jgi:opacity protein-like surface antigen
MWKRLSWIACATLLFAATTSDAASGDPIRYHGWIGYSGISGDADKLVKDGWSVGFGVLWTPQKGMFQLRGDLGYDWWDVKTGNIPSGEVRIDDGNASAWYLRGGIQVGTKREGFNFYGGAGIGGYYVKGELTQEALVSGIWCDWWGWCYPITTVGDVIVADESTTKFGYYAMVGGSFQVGSGDLFIEATYNWVQTKNTFEYFPIVVGYRW